MASTPNSNISYYRNAAADNTKVLVRSGNTNLVGFTVHNPNAAAIGFLQLFDAAATTDVTLGTTVPAEIIGIAGNGVVSVITDDNPFYSFVNGLVIAATTTAGGSTTAATALNVVLKYK